MQINEYTQNTLSKEVSSKFQTVYTECHSIKIHVAEDCSVVMALPIISVEDRLPAQDSLHLLHKIRETNLHQFTQTYNQHLMLKITHKCVTTYS